MVPHTSFAFTLKVKKGSLVRLRGLLHVMGSDPANNRIFSFSKLEAVHFGRWLIIEGRDHKLIYAVDFDGKSYKKHLMDMYQYNAQGMDEVLSCCEGYPLESDNKKKIRFLRKNKRRIAAFYVGTKGRSVRQILNEHNLRQDIRCFLNGIQDHPFDEQGYVRHIKEFVQGRKDLHWALKKPKGYTLGYQLFRGLFFIFHVVQVILFVMLLICLFPLTLLFIMHIRKLEKTDPEFEEEIARGKKQVLEEMEDHYLHNQISIIVDIKSGTCRFLAQCVMMWLIHLLAKYIFRSGHLGGIPSIHFACWIIVDRRLLFFTNFDGSWMSYLSDFIDNAAKGITAAWSNTMGFPKTEYLINKGAASEHGFKRWARNLQVPTQVWYSAYPYYSVEAINNNSKVRKGLASRLKNRKRALTWLKRI